MADAVIVATTRSPIGRTPKGSLAGMRPDELSARSSRRRWPTAGSWCCRTPRWPATMRTAPPSPTAGWRA